MYVPRICTHHAGTTHTPRTHHAHTGAHTEQADFLYGRNRDEIKDIFECAGFGLSEQDFNFIFEQASARLARPHPPLPPRVRLPPARVPFAFTVSACLPACLPHACRMFPHAQRMRPAGHPLGPQRPGLSRVIPQGTERAFEFDAHELSLRACLALHARGGAEQQSNVGVLSFGRPWSYVV